MTNLLNGYYQSGGHQITQSDQPEASYLRRMLSQSRAERPKERAALSAFGHRVRVERVQIFNMTEAIHLIPKTAQSGSSYTLRNANGSLPMSGIGSGGTCSVMERSTYQQTSWTLVTMDEGDFAVEDVKSGLALGILNDTTGGTLQMGSFQGGYDQRWRVDDLGDGTVAFRNRATNQVLEWPESGCAGLADDPVRSSGKWAVQAN